MIILNHPQGSIEWITARLWRLTASEMKRNITSTGKLSESQAAIENIDKLIAGIDLANEIRSNPGRIADLDDRELRRFMSHYNGDSFAGNIHTERGHDCEADAIAALSERIGAQVHDVGMVIMGDDPNGVVACSPDGLVWDAGRIVAGAEVKARCLSTYYGHIAAGKLPDDTKHQVHAGMAICEVDVWHFGSYFRGKPLFHLEIRRDSFTDAMAESLKRFRDQYADRFALVQERLKALENQRIVTK